MYLQNCSVFPEGVKFGTYIIGNRRMLGKSLKVDVEKNKFLRSYTKKYL